MKKTKENLRGQDKETVRHSKGGETSAMSILYTQRMAKKEENQSGYTCARFQNPYDFITSGIPEDSNIVSKELLKEVGAINDTKYLFSVFTTDYFSGFSFLIPAC